MVSLANSLHDLARKVARMDMKALEAGRGSAPRLRAEWQVRRSAVQRRCLAGSRATQRSQ